MNPNPNWFERLLALNPLVVRGFVMTVIGLIGACGIVLGDDIVQAVISFTMALLGLLTALWGRSSVTPNAKVLAYLPNPIDAPDTIEAGEATVDSSHALEVIDAATNGAS